MNWRKRPPPHEAAERLDSWKEIASYLKRGVRTVQRWEKEEGLPVRRHLHDRGGTVYARKTDLDAWWESHQGNHWAQASTFDRAGRLKPLLLGAPLAALLVVSATWLYLAKTAVELPFEERDWLLVTAFDNRTGEERFDDSIAYALEHELAASSYVNVVPRPRIDDALRLMGLPAGSRVDFERGREICLRDGGIRAFLSGRIEKWGESYVLSARLHRPSDGLIVQAFEQGAKNETEALKAVRRLSSSVREGLGERPDAIARTEAGLARVTTPSLRALQLYSKADALMESGSGGDGAARALLEKAIEEDPNFASAYIHLAWDLRNRRHPPEEYLPLAHRALELSERVSAAERLFIEGSFHQMANDPERAVQLWEALVELEPDHYWGWNNLATANWETGRDGTWTPILRKLAEIRPLSLRALLDAADATLMDPGLDATPLIRRARRLSGLPEFQAAYPSYAVEAQLWTLSPRWQSGSMDELMIDVAEVEALGRVLEPSGKRELARLLGRAYLTFGQIEKSESFFAELPEDLRQFELAHLRLLEGSLSPSSPLILELEQRRSYPIVPLLFARIGDLEGARRLIDAQRDRYPHRHRYGLMDLAEGEIALAEGRPRDAIRLIRSGFEADRPSGGIASFLATESLAKAWQLEGEPLKALVALERASRQRDLYLFPYTSHFWIRNEAFRAKLLRQMNRPDDAEAIETELSELLVFADGDYLARLELSSSPSGPVSTATR